MRRIFIRRFFLLQNVQKNELKFVLSDESDVSSDESDVLKIEPSLILSRQINKNDESDESDGFFRFIH